MPLFKVDKKNIKHNIIQIQGENLKHLTKSLRKKKDDIIDITDSEYIIQAKIIDINKDHLKAQIISKNQASLLHHSLTIYMSMTRFSTFDSICNIATQLGASRIVPVLSEYSNQISPPEKRIIRWKKIIEESAKQSYNIHPPLLEPMTTFSKAITEKGINILFEPEGKLNLKQVLKNVSTHPVNVFIGPEGGYSQNEIKLALKNKTNIVRLPFYILKSETAVITAVSNIIFYLD